MISISTFSNRQIIWRKNTQRNIRDNGFRLNDFLDIYKIVYPNTKEYTFSLASYGSISKTQHIQGHKTNLYKFKKVGVWPQCKNFKCTAETDQQTSKQNKETKNKTQAPVNRPACGLKQLIIKWSMSQWKKSTKKKNLWGTLEAILWGSAYIKKKKN